MCSIICLGAFSQEEEDHWASPAVTEMQLGRGIVFGYKRMSPYNIVSESQVPDLVENAESDIERIRNLVVKVRIPVVARDRSQFVIGLEYNTDEFEFENIEYQEYRFYRELHQKSLRGRGIKLYYNHGFDDRKYIFFRGSAELNGDIPDEAIDNALRFSLAGIYGWKISPTKAWGIGFYFSYSFGRPLLLPAVVYNNTWSKRWGIEAAFPATVMLRHNINSKNFLYFGYNVEGGSYNIDLGSTLNERFNNIQVRRSEVMPKIVWEREIYDFIWFSLEGGFRYNINFNVTEDTLFDEKRILVNDVTSGVFVGASVFVIPTESLKKLFKKD